jgi:hypothetical protein
MWLKLAKIDQFSNFFGYFHHFQVVEYTGDSFKTNTFKNKNFSEKYKNSIFGQILPNFANFMN